MDKLIIFGGKPLRGQVTVGGAKNVAMKVIIAALLTDEQLVVKNIPFISSVLGTTNIVKPLGVEINQSDHTLTINSRNIHAYKIPLEFGGLYRTATMVIGPLLARFGRAIVPNPGGCRLGKRPVDWHMQALRQMGAKIVYKDGYFYTEAKRLHGTRIKFEKNTHTGTETVILAAVLAQGETVIENAAQEPEIDDLMQLLNLMGANVRREGNTIQIKGVTSLKGASYSIMPDRNEAVTYAIAAIVTRGDVTVVGTQRQHLREFLKSLDEAGGGWEPVSEHATRFYWKGSLKPTQVVSKPHPGFMTDWQAPWAILASQAEGTSTIHETVFEQRFSYVLELRKMGAKIDFYHPYVRAPKTFYNFNWDDRIEGYFQGIKIHGLVELHEGVVEIDDLRAGVTLVVAALAAHGKSTILGVEHIDRGYEHFDRQLRLLGANIKRIKEIV